MLRDGDQVVRRQIHDLAKKTGDSARTHETHVLAKVRAPDTAHLAMSARDGRLEREMIAFADARYSSADVENDSGRLMPEHHRVLALRIANAAFSKVVHVRTADSHGSDPHLYFTGAGRFHLLIDDSKLSDSD